MHLLGRHKYLPYRRWYRRELASYIKEVTLDRHTLELPYWNPTFVTSMADMHIAGRRNYARELNAVLTLESTNRTLLQAKFPEPSRKLSNA